MSGLGLGVLLNLLGGNAQTVAAYHAAKGKTILSAALDEEDNRLTLTFAEGVLTVWDGGQSCCESRYMRTDDDLAALAGATLLDMEVKPGPETTDGWGEPHEVEFFELTTDKGPVTIANHNEHNGYYGGFSLKLQWKES